MTYHPQESDDTVNMKAERFRSKASTATNPDLRQLHTPSPTSYLPRDCSRPRREQLPHVMLNLPLESSLHCYQPWERGPMRGPSHNADNVLTTPQRWSQRPSFRVLLPRSKNSKFHCMVLHCPPHAE